MNWYEKLGYGKNPLSVDPFKTEISLIKYDDEFDQANKLLKGKNAIVLEGPDGSGKTTFLFNLLRVNPKSIYLDAKKVCKNSDFEKILRKKLKTFFGWRKDIHLLLDNADELSLKNLERLKYFFDENKVNSLVMTTSSSDIFNDNFRSRIGKRIFRLRQASAKDAIVIIRKLLKNNGKMLSDSLILKIFYLSDSDIKLHITNCESLLKYLVKNDLDDISENDLELLLTDSHFSESPAEKNCFNCGKELVLVGVHWRCPVCDFYCYTCGGLVIEDDELCPHCKRSFIK